MDSKGAEPLSESREEEEREVVLREGFRLICVKRIQRTQAFTHTRVNHHTSLGHTGLKGFPLNKNRLRFFHSSGSNSSEIFVTMHSHRRADII